MLETALLVVLVLVAFVALTFAISFVAACIGIASGLHW